MAPSGEECFLIDEEAAGPLPCQCFKGFINFAFRPGPDDDQVSPEVVCNFLSQLR